MNYEFDDVKNKVKLALNLLIENDSYLLEHDANEENLSSTLHCYLKKQFREFDVDCEYNRRQKGASKLLNVSRTGKREKSFVTPDIIIHSRESTDNNYLVIEVKKTNNSNREILFDEEKLKEFTFKGDKDDTSTLFGYSYGLSVIFKSEKDFRLDDPVLKWFIDGKMVEVENL